ncbi:MAG: phosphotransferase family protein [Acidimicrobiia bacterium]|nr:phosphotransferase family protein [Acidimicrobiia bacterium]
MAHSHEGHDTTEGAPIMPIPEQRDLEAARGIVAGWLARRLPGASDVEVGPISGPAFTGFSNETLLFDASWLPADAAERVTEALVLRVEPTVHTVFLEADFESQYRVIQTLGERSAVPVPPMKWFEPDTTILGAAFFVMGAVVGRAPTDTPPYTQGGWVLEETTPAQRRTLVENGLDALASVHAVDWKDLGFEYLDKPQYGRLGFEQQLRYYEASFAWASPDRDPPPVAQATLDWVRAHAPTTDPEITLCWGDARINNQLFDADCRVAAVLDWEMVTLADPMMDLGWWLFLDRHFHEGMPAPRMEGFPTREEMVARYEQTSGRVARDLEFYEVFGGLRFAVVMMRLSALLVDFEILPVDTDMAVNNAVTRVLADMLDLPSPGPAPEAIS